MEFGLGFVSGSLATGLAVKYRGSIQKRLAGVAITAERKIASALRSLGARL